MSGRLVASPISVIESDEVFEARIAWPGVTASSSREDGLLDLHPLGHGLDDEVDVAEVLVGGGAGDPPDDLARPAPSACSSVSLLLLDEPASWPCGDVARLLEAGVDELLLDVLEHDGDVGGGDRLGDLAAHGAGADDGGLEHEHGAGRL